MDALYDYLYLNGKYTVLTLQSEVLHISIYFQFVALIKQFFTVGQLFYEIWIVRTVT